MYLRFEHHFVPIKLFKRIYNFCLNSSDLTRNKLIFLFASILRYPFTTYQHNLVTQLSFLLLQKRYNRCNRLSTICSKGTVHNYSPRNGAP